MSKASPRGVVYSPLFRFGGIGATILVSLTLFAASAVAHPLTTPLLPSSGPGETVRQSEFYALDQSTRLMNEQDYIQAIPHLNEALEKDPTNLIGIYNLGFCFLELAKRSQSPELKASLLNKAEEAFLRIRDLNESLSTTYFKLGKVALMQNDLDKAEQYYLLGLEQEPGNAALEFNLARVYDQKESVDEAIQHYERTLALSPKFIYAYNNLGLMYERKKWLSKAEDVYKKALKREPSYNLPRMNLGNLYAEQNRLKEAEALYLEALRLEPGNAWANLYLGNVYFRMERFDDAVRHYEASIQGNPDYPTTYYLMAIACSKLQRTDDALQASLHYVNLAPGGEFSQEMKSLILSLKLQRNGGVVLISHPASTGNGEP